MNNAEGKGESALVVYGGLVAEVNPTDLPQGSAPICCDMDFTIGSVFTRDGIQGVYQLEGNCLGCAAATGTSVADPDSSDEVPFSNPGNITSNMPGTYASVTLQDCGGPSPGETPSVFGGSVDGAIEDPITGGTITSGFGINFAPSLAELVAGTPTVIFIPCFAFDFHDGSAKYPVSITDNRGNSYTAITPRLVTDNTQMGGGHDLFGFIVYALVLPSGVDLGAGDYVITFVWEAAVNLQPHADYPVVCLNCTGIDQVTYNTIETMGGTMTFPNITTSQPDCILSMWSEGCCSGSYVRLMDTTQILVNGASGGVVVYSDGSSTSGASLVKPAGTYGGSFALPGASSFSRIQNGVSIALTLPSGGGGGGGGETCDTSENLVGTNFMCLPSIPEGAPVFGVQIFVNGKQSTEDPSAVIKITFSDMGTILGTTTLQLPLTDGSVSLGGPTESFGLTREDLLSGTLTISVQATSDVEATFDISGLTIRICFGGVGCDFDWIGTFEQQDADLLTLALDSCGTFWQEDVNNDPNVLVPFYTNILPNTFGVGVTEDDREFIALSNLQYGTDMPRQYDGTNLDRISQVGPGAPPQVTFASNEYPIVSITQDMQFTFSQIRAVLWSSGPTQTHTPGNVLTFYFLNGTDISQIQVGSGVVLSGFVGDLAGINSTTPYVVTSVGTAQGSGGTFPIITVIAPSVNNVDQTPSAGTLHLTLATLTTSIPVPNLQVGNQINVSGVTPATWDGTWTVLFTPNASQLSINTTSLTGNVATYAYTIVTGTAPTVGELVTVTGTSNGNGIFNVSGVAITAVSPGTFSVSITSPDIAAAAEAGNAIVNGTIFQFDPGQVIPDGTGGFVTVAGGLGAGTRGAVVMFLTRNGYLTAPSPPVIFTLNESANSIIVSQLPIGPPDTIARVVAFTGAGGATQSGGGGFYYWIPTPVSVLDAGQNVIYSATIINDNTTTTATFTFTDAVLLAAASISFQGSNNFAQIELGPSIGVIAYASRLFAWGTNNKVNNLLNFSFDGGIGQIVPPPSSGTPITTYPLGWVVNQADGFGGSVVPSPLFGDSYQISNTSGSTQAVYGLIQQNAYQDSDMVPIIQSHTTYSVRVTASSTSSNGTLVIDLWSDSMNKEFGLFEIPLSSMTSKMQIFTGTLLTTPFEIVPNDLLIRVYTIVLPNNASVLVDRFEVFPTEQPVLTTEVLASYFNNFEAFDEITGVVGVGTQNQQPVRSCFSLFDNLYVVKTNSMYVTSDNGVTEPDGWTVREVSNKVGTPSIYGVDYGQGWALIFGQQGLFVFDGGQPVPIAPEIEPLIRKINWKYGNTVWVKNDTTLRKIYIGIPIATPNQWMPNFPANANPTVPNVVLMCQYKELNTSGALEYEGSIRQSYMGELRTYQLGRKWSTWSIEAHFGDFIKRPDTTTPLFLCADDGSGRINTQIEGLHTDNGTLIHSLYCTYPFVKAQEAQGLQLGQHNIRAHYASMFIEGGGNVDVTIIPDSLQSPYSNALEPLPLGDPPPWGDTEFPLNDFGARFFTEFKPHAIGDWWELSRLVLDVTKDAWSPVRGGNF